MDETFSPHSPNFFSISLGPILFSLHFVSFWLSFSSFVSLPAENKAKKRQDEASNPRAAGAPIVDQPAHFLPQTEAFFDIN